MPCSAQLTAGGISNGRNHSGGELAGGGVGEQAGGRGGGGGLPALTQIHLMDN